MNDIVLRSDHSRRTRSAREITYTKNALKYSLKDGDHEVDIRSLNHFVFNKNCPEVPNGWKIPQHKLPEVLPWEAPRKSVIWR